MTGVRVEPLRAALLVMLAVTVVLSLQTVGVLLSVALLIVPAATAKLWCRTVGAMSAVASLLGTTSALLGLTISYHASTPPGATIAICAVSFLAIGWASTVPRRAGATAERSMATRKAESLA